MQFTKQFVDELTERLGGFKYEWTAAHLEQIFTPPSYFDVLRSAQPCFLVGARGSGKTTALIGITKIGTDLEKGVDSAIFAVYERVDTGKTSAFSGAGIERGQWDKIFSHYLNLVIIYRLFREAARRGFDSVTAEDAEDLNLCMRLLHLEFTATTVTTPKQICDILQSAIIDLEAGLNDIERLPQINLSLLLDPIRVATAFLKRKLTKARIIYIFDEYENFDIHQQRVVNTLIKHSAPDLIVKVGLKEYGHRTKNVLSEGQTLTHPADYVEMQISECFGRKEFRDFATKVLDVRLGDLLDNSPAGDIFEKISLEQEYENCLDEKEISELNSAFDGIEVPENLSLLQRKFLLLQSNSKKIDLKTLCASWKKPLSPIKTKYGNYSYSIVLSESKSQKSSDLVRKMFSGIDTLADLAGSNIRYFLELVHQSIVIQLRLNTSADLISAKAQTLAAYQVGRRTLENTTDGALHGTQIKGCILGIGRVFELLARSPFGRRPEITTFRLKGASIAEYREANAIIKECIKEGLMLASVVTKRSGLATPRTNEYRIHPLLAPFLGFSHRKKRSMDFYPSEIIALSHDPEDGVKQVVARLRLEPAATGEAAQPELFE